MSALADSVKKAFAGLAVKAGPALATALPKMKIAAIVIATVTAILIGTYSGGMAVGAAKQRAKTAQDELARQQRDQKVIDGLNAQVTKLKEDHAKFVANLRAEFIAVNEREKAADAKRIADLRSGSSKLRLAIASCDGAQAAAGPLGTATPGATPEARAELAPEVAATLFGITGDGDAAIRQLAGLQSWAMNAVATCNKEIK